MLTRTYSRKSSKRSARSVTITRSPSVSPEPDRSPTPPPRQRKRQKIQVEVVRPRSSSRARGRNAAREEGGSSTQPRARSTHSQGPPSSRRKPAFASTSADLKTTLSRHGMSSKELQRSDTLREGSVSPVKDLSELFAISVSSPSKRAGLSPGLSGVAKRMHPLRRAQTDSSVGASPSNDLPRPTPRRLGVARTESIIDLTYSSTGGTNSPVPGPSTPFKDQSSQKEESSPAVRPTLTGPNASSVRTYAGKSRSFLVALPASQMHSLSNDVDDSSYNLLNGTQEEELETRESYTTLRQRYGVDNSEDDPMLPLEPESVSNSPNRKGKGKAVERLPEGMMNDLKSISELRNKGETRRFLDEVGYLFEGLDPEGTIGVRRGSALEIVSKLCDVDFARRAQAADFLNKAWEMLRKAGAGEPGGDKVLNTIFVFFAALVAKDEGDLAELASSHQSSITASNNSLATTLCDLLIKLTSENDPLWLSSTGMNDAELKKAGIGRGDKTVLAGLWRMVRKKSGLFREDESVSNRLLISFTLSRLPSNALPTTLLPMFLTILNRELSVIPSRIAAYTSGLQLVQPVSLSSYKEVVSLAHIENCLRLLDSLLLQRWEDDDDEPTGGSRHGRKTQRALDKAKEDGLGESLVGLCLVTEILRRQPNAREQRETVEKCTQSAIRVLINLSHDSVSWCQAITSERLTFTTLIRLITSAQAQRQRIGAEVKIKSEPAELPAASDDEDEEPQPEDDTSAQLLDRLCLALGLLTNLVQGTAQAKQLIGETLIAPNCPGKRTCIYICTCPSRVSALECLVQVYGQLCQSTSDFDTVVRGHIAVLFGLLMQENLKNQQTLLRTLSGTTQRKRLDALIENAKDFTAFYVRFSERAAQVLRERTREDDQDIDAEEDEAQLGESRRDLENGLQGVLHDSKGEDVANSAIQFLEGLRKRVSDGESQ